MAEAIAREPALAGRIVEHAQVSGSARALADLLVRAASASAPASAWPVTAVGCGSSEHAAIAAAEIWRDAWRRLELPGPGPVARQALEAAADPWPGATVGISHEGGSWATVRALRAARDLGSWTGLISSAANSPAAEAVDACVCTLEVDPSWCHTIGYLAPVVAAAAIGGELGGDVVDGSAIRRLIEAGIGEEGAARILGRNLGSSRALVVAASGADRAAGRELALKLEEASHVQTSYRDLETLMHGHLAALDIGSAVVVVLTDRAGRALRVARARQLLTAVKRVGAIGGAILAADAASEIPEALTPSGRVVVPEVPELPAPVAATIGSAAPLQLTAYHLALALGTNPDTMRREFTPYRLAAEAAASPEEAL